MLIYSGTTVIFPSHRKSREVKTCLSASKKSTLTKEEWAGSFWLPWVCMLWGIPFGLGSPRIFQQTLSQPHVFCYLTWSVCPCSRGLRVSQAGWCEAACQLYLGATADRNTFASYSLWWSHLAWGSSKVWWLLLHRWWPEAQVSLRSS